MASEIDHEKMLRLFDEYVKQVDRVDGDGLLPRKNRKLPWNTIVAKLRDELKSAKTKFEVGRVFARFDATYTNLHAHIDLNPEYSFRSESKLKIAIAMMPEVLTRDGAKAKYRLAIVRKELFKNLDDNKRPAVGDEVTAINGRSMEDWANENFEFCKFPLRTQCDLNFWDDFKSEVLSWYRRMPLTISVKRNGKILTFNVPVVARANGQSDEPASTPPCGVDHTRYPGFKIAYNGHHACVFESPVDPGVAVLRIRSFRYKNLPESAKIKNIRDETSQFSQSYWTKNSKLLKTLVIDVVENLGGDAVTSWSSLFIPTAFQDQWVQFKKLQEFSEPSWQSEAFYNDKGKFAVVKKWQKDGTWAKIKTDDFLPPMPQFCVSENGDCLKEAWPTEHKEFTGKYVILTDHWCISSCVGFVWTMKNYLKERVSFAGVPDSGDSTYSRAYIEGRLIDRPPYVSISVTSRPSGTHAEVGKDAIFKQAVSVSRSTDDKGNIISGMPQKMDLFLSQNWDQSVDNWVAKLVKESLNH